MWERKIGTLMISRGKQAWEVAPDSQVGIDFALRQHAAHLLASQGSAGRGQRDGLDAQPGPVGVQELRLPLDLLPVGHEQRLEAETAREDDTPVGLRQVEANCSREIRKKSDRPHLHLLDFFQPLELTEPHVLGLDAPSPHEQAVGGR